MTQTIDAPHADSRPQRANERSERVLLLGVIGAITILVLVRGPEATADSGSYLLHTPLRPPGYPTYLSLCRLLFGESLYLRASVGLQTALGLLAAARLSRLVASLSGGSSRVGAFGIWGVLAVGELYFGHMISSEGIAYALFLAWTAAVIDVVLDSRLRSLAAVGGFTLLLLLQRVQFLFLLPAMALGTLLLAFARGRRVFVAGVCVLAAVVALHQATSRVYSHLVGGSGSTASALGVQLLTITTYLSDPSDLNALEDPTERDFFREAQDYAQKHDNLGSQRHEGVPTFADVNNAYNPTCWFALIGTYDRMMLGRPPPSYSVTVLTTLATPAEWRQMDRFFTRVSLHLLRRSWPRYLRYLLTVLFEQYKYWVLVVGGMLGAALIHAKRDPPLSALVALVSTLWITNFMLVAAVEVTMGRYLFYTDSLVAAILISIVSARFERPSDAGRVRAAKPLRSA